MHEEDYGILWKHRRPARPARRRCAGRAGSSCRPSHRRQLRVRLLLVLLPRRQHPARGQAHRHRVDRWRSRPASTPRVRHVVAPGARRAEPPAPVLRPARPRRRRRRQHGLRGRRRGAAARPGQPVRQRVRRAARRRSRPSADAQRDDRPARPPARGGSSTPTCATGSASRSATSSCPATTPDAARAARTVDVGRRAGFARHNLWVTPYAPDERRAAGEYPNQHAGGDGLPRGPRQDRVARRHRRRASGTRSASRTSCARRTGRSCRSSTPASR